MSSCSYLQGRAICPFYLMDNTQPPNIHCEGLEEGNKIIMQFRNGIQKKDYFDDYCAGYYWQCPVYQIVNQKYTPLAEVEQC